MPPSHYSPWPHSRQRTDSVVGPCSLRPYSAPVASWLRYLPPTTPLRSRRSRQAICEVESALRTLEARRTRTHKRSHVSPIPHAAATTRGRRLRGRPRAGRHTILHPEMTTSVSKLPLPIPCPHAPHPSPLSHSFKLKPSTSVPIPVFILSRTQVRLRKLGPPTVHQSLLQSLLQPMLQPMLQ